MKYVFTLALTLISLSAWGQDFVGTSGDDVLVGSSGDDTFQGGDGSDEIYGQGGDDTITVCGSCVIELAVGKVGEAILFSKEGTVGGFKGEGHDDTY